MNEAKMNLLEEEEIIYKGNPYYKTNRDLLVVGSMILIILMEIFLYISINKMIHFDIIRVVLIIIFVGEDIYLYFSLKKKKILCKNDVIYYLTNKRIIIQNLENNSLIIEKLENCSTVITQNSNKDFGDVIFYKSEDNKEEIMRFKNIGNYEDVAKKAQEELKKFDN